MFIHFEYVLIASSAFFASLLSFYSGFGLGTLLMPVIAIFFPLPLAIGLTAVVHWVHNFSKAILLRQEVHWNIVWHFGMAAVFAAVPGALLLKGLALLPPIAHYTVFSIQGEISLLPICIGLLLLLFATLEMWGRIPLSSRNLYFGGFLSGFFGGLSGNQGAFRSLFLLQTEMSARAFLGTNAFIATAVDSVRLLLYGWSFPNVVARANLPLVAVTLCSALGGICLGMYLLPRVPLSFIRKLVIGLLYSLGMLFIIGIL